MNLRLARTLFVPALLALLAAPVHAGKTTNKYGITMVDIPAGSFLMGSCKMTDGEAKHLEEENKKRAFLGKASLSVNLGCSLTDSDADDWETPQHRVSIKKFQMGKTEVTLGQFKQFIAAAGRDDLVNDEFMQNNRYGNDAPVVNVSWHDAQAFIQWLNKTDGGGWRLPSEAEWEYACRAGDMANKYCGGDDLNAVGWWDGNSGGRQRTVGQKRANAFGLHDMSGNVWEWVQDCWHNSYRGAPNDDSTWTSACNSDGRGLRGGSWVYSARSSRAASRNTSVGPEGRNLDFGFRLARTR